MVSGEAEFDISAYSTLTNAVRRVFETIGLKRVPRNVTPGTLEGVVAASSPVPDLSQLSNAELDRLYALHSEAREGPPAALRGSGAISRPEAAEGYSRLLYGRANRRGAAENY